MVGITPALFMSKRQGEIKISMYIVKFCAMKTTVEEVPSVIYMLRCLGVKVKYYVFLCGDNRGVIHNITNSDILLKIKHVAIAYHRTIESSKVGVFIPSRSQ